MYDPGTRGGGTGTQNQDTDLITGTLEDPDHQTVEMDPKIGGPREVTADRNPGAKRKG